MFFIQQTLPKSVRFLVLNCRQMTYCIIDIRNLREANLLRLNDSKTEFVVLASNHIEIKLGDNVRLIKVGETELQAASTAHNIV